MKAVILTAGVGSRIRPLTDHTPKPLLSVGKTTILGNMVANLAQAGISEFVIVTGYMHETIIDFLKKNFPQLQFHFVHNELYLQTNTAYSMLLAKPWVWGNSFIKCDGDVIFEYEIINRLISNSNENCLCIDTNINLAAEEVKVTVDNQKNITAVGKSLDPAISFGESIGIEKLGVAAGKAFLEELETLMQNQDNYKRYYDDSYTTLVAQKHTFAAVDVTGLKWVEIDTHEDYHRAQELFSSMA